MTHNRHCNLYIASCERDGGIIHYRINENGELSFIKKTPADRPMYMAISNDKMYVVLREPFKDSDDSGVVVYDINDDGMLENPAELESTHGAVGCHILVNDGSVYVANYISGSVIKMPKLLVQHSGKGENAVRQNGPHTHFACATPDNKYICVTDLGLDKIFVYDKNMNLFSSAAVPSGHGVRHLAFSDDGKWLFSANELKSTVSAFSYSGGKLEIVDTASALPENFDGESTAAAIRVYNGHIYVSNRGHDSISKLEFKNNKIKLISVSESGGSSPRDFDFVNGLLVCTNENSNNVTVFDRQKDGSVKLAANVEVSAPICVVSR